MLLESCSDACGWTAATISMLGFGTFGVPIKSDAANKVNIDPLVMQSYKSITCFLLSFTVLLFGQEFSFTPWAILSGLFWVPGGTAVIYSIRNAGLALTVGINSSFIVLVSFTWGIFIFEEHVKSRFVASLAVLLMISGIWGMTYFTQPHLQSPLGVVKERASHRKARGSDEDFQQPHQQHPEYSTVQIAPWHSNESEFVESSMPISAVGQDRDSGTRYDLDRINSSSDFSEEELESEQEESYQRIDPSSTVVFCGRYWSRRHLGIACSVFNGLWVSEIVRRLFCSFSFH